MSNIIWGYLAVVPKNAEVSGISLKNILNTLLSMEQKQMSWYVDPFLLALSEAGLGHGKFTLEAGEASENWFTEIGIQLTNKWYDNDGSYSIGIYRK